MIISKTIDVKITKREILEHYLDIGYNCTINEYFKINIDDLKENSGILIECKCDKCDKIVKKKYREYLKNKSNQYFACSYKCAIDKTKNTCLKKYGTEYALQSNTIRNKSKETNLKKYGTEYYLQSETGKNNYKKVCLERYGVENTYQSKDKKDKIKETNLNKYKATHYIKSKKYKTKIINNRINNIISLGVKYNNISTKDNLIFIKCEKCSKQYNIEYKLLIQRLNYYKTDTCTICNPIKNNLSYKEKEVLYFVKTIYNGIIIEGDRKVLEGKELDIYLPEIQIAFEFNGTYWHSEKFKDKDYHSNKTKNCLKKNIDLTHIWEKDWINKREYIKI